MGVKLLVMGVHFSGWLGRSSHRIGGKLDGSTGGRIVQQNDGLAGWKLAEMESARILYSM